jgi:hypothetical protein
VQAMTSRMACTRAFQGSFSFREDQDPELMLGGFIVARIAFRSHPFWPQAATRGGECQTITSHASRQGSSKSR